jgi:hypothetical protein
MTDQDKKPQDYELKNAIAWLEPLENIEQLTSDHKQAIGYLLKLAHSRLSGECFASDFPKEEDYGIKTGGDILFMDLGHRLIKRIFEFNSDEHDIELNLCGIIEKAKKYKALSSIPRQSVCPKCKKEIFFGQEYCEICKHELIPRQLATEEEIEKIIDSCDTEEEMGCSCGADIGYIDTDKYKLLNLLTGKIPRQSECPECRGEGEICQNAQDYDWKKCKVCNGTGKVPRQMATDDPTKCTHCGFEMKFHECNPHNKSHIPKIEGEQKCPVCNGKGKHIEELKCLTCNGSGKKDRK